MSIRCTSWGPIVGMLAVLSCDSNDAPNSVDVTSAPPGNPELCPALPAVSSNGGTTTEIPTFTKVSISEQPGSAFLVPRDLNGNGFPEFMLIAISEGKKVQGFPPLRSGGGYILTREDPTLAGTPEGWSLTKVFDRSDGVDWPNTGTIFDVDNDGIDDWLVGAGFLLYPTGRLVWFKGEMDGGRLTFGEMNDIEVPYDDYWYHLGVPVDMDGDGDLDFVTTSHKGDAASINLEPGFDHLEWFENMGIEGEGRFVVHEIDDAGGALIELHDVDGDGDQDILLPQFFAGESLLWYEQTGAAGTSWDKHVIADDLGRGFEVRVADVNGDGREDIVFDNHNHQLHPEEELQTMGVYWFEVPGPNELKTLDNWDDTRHVIYEGFEVISPEFDQSSAPGVFNTGDIDGDGDLDVVISGDGDPGLYLSVQNAGGEFETITLDSDPSNVNSGQQHIVDVDGDCDMDIVWAVFGDTGVPEVLVSNIYVFLQN